MKWGRGLERSQHMPALNRRLLTVEFFDFLIESIQLGDHVLMFVKQAHGSGDAVTDIFKQCGVSVTPGYSRRTVHDLKSTDGIARHWA